MINSYSRFFTYFYYSFVAVSTVLFCLGLYGYAGNKFLYVLFSLASALILVSAFRKFTSYGYSYLAVFLWLGFWLKLTLHLILNYPFVEPVGNFTGAPAELDQMMVVVTVAFLGLVCGNAVFDFVKRKWSSKEISVGPQCPNWYKKYRRVTWIAMIAITIITIYMNIKFGIHMIGMLPRTILVWPLNSIIAWSLNIGFATAFSAMIWWDVLLSRDISKSIYAIVVEAFLSSVAIMSRALYIFHSVPQLFAISRIGAGGSNRKKIILASSFVIFLVMSIASVSTLRNYLYQSTETYSSTRYQVAHARWEVVSGLIDTLRSRLSTASYSERLEIENEIRLLLIERAQLEKISTEEKAKFKAALAGESRQASFLLNEFGYQLRGGFVTQMMHLSVDRWIGLEGALSVVTYPEKSMDLFFHALTDKATPGKPDIYQKISESIYLKADMDVFKFASLPGAIGFLFYTGSYFCVALGMFVFSLLILLLEGLVGLLTKNPLLCSLYGAAFASNIAQFGVEPRSSISYYMMLGLGVLCIAAVQLNFSAILEYARLKFIKIG